MQRLKLTVTMICFWLVSAANAFTPEVATVETLPDNQGEEWFWISGNRAPSFADGQAYLFSETGKRLGQVSTGFWFNSLVNAHKRDEIVTVETYFSRGTRGERTDVVVMRDAITLNVKGEIEIPGKRMNAVRNDGLAVLTEDERYLLVVNYTPAQSISIVDLDKAMFVEEIETPGCSVLYAAGNRDFYSICGNGGFMQIKIGDDGRVVSRTRSQPLFDPVNDFLTISASRIGNTWYFVSRQNNVYAILMDGDRIELLNTWSLTTQSEREDEWIISGFQHTATHAERGELFVLMHQGAPDTFEEPGTHVWVYDVKTQQKAREIELDGLGGSSGIAVTQDSTPRLYTLDFHFLIPDLFAMWVYFMDGEAMLQEMTRQRASAYDAKSGRKLFHSDLVPNGGFVFYIKTW